MVATGSLEELSDCSGGTKTESGGRGGGQGVGDGVSSASVTLTVLWAHSPAHRPLPALSSLQSRAVSSAPSGISTPVQAGQ